MALTKARQAALDYAGTGLSFLLGYEVADEVVFIREDYLQILSKVL